MFDAATARLIRAAPALPDIDPAVLPQRLTRDYVELVSLRLHAAQDDVSALKRQRLADLRQIATIYEAIVDRGAQGDGRRAAAFVAATAHQLHARFLGQFPANRKLLNSASVDSAIAAPLLFLIAEQNPDGREAAIRLPQTEEEDLVRTALVETIVDIATERYDDILGRAERLADLSVHRGASMQSQAVQSLYGICWRGLTQLVCRVLGRPLPQSRSFTFDGPGAAFERVVELSTQEIGFPIVDGFDLPPDGGRLFSTYAGPRHLARLLSLVANSLDGSGITNLPTPPDGDPDFWRGWLDHRSHTKPVLWRSHKVALRRDFHLPGQSAVLVLPTGAGKTTLSEVKIAAALSVGRKVVFLVPTLALVDQLRDDLAESFPDSLTITTPSINSDLAVLAGGVELEQLEVMTPERCLAILSFAPHVFADVGLIVFDECHLLGPAGGGTRSVDAMLCFLQAVRCAPNADLLLLSAMLTNPAEIAAWIEALTGRPCQSISDVWKPSRQARGVVVYRREEIRAATALIIPWRRRIAMAKAAKQKSPKKPRTSAVPFALFGLQHHWHPNVPQDTRLVRLLNSPVDLAIAQGGNRLTPNANAVAAHLAAQAVASGLKTIVFVQNAGHAPSTAHKLRNQLPEPNVLDEQERVLWDNIRWNWEEPTTRL